MDKKTKIQFVITGILVIFLIFLINNAKNDLIKKNVRSNQEESILAPVERSNGRMSYQKLLKANTDLTLSRDPFVYRSIKHRASSPSLSSGLSAILWDKDQALAVINHKVVKKGDKTGLYTVVDIKPDKVILNDGTAVLLRPAVRAEGSQ